MAQAGSRQAGAQSTPPAEQTQSKPTADQAADRVAELEAENAQLRAQLEAAGVTAAARAPYRPSFIAEGTREELERTGRAVDPFSGARLVGTGKPGEKPREVSAEEFRKAGKPATAAAPAGPGSETADQA